MCDKKNEKDNFLKALFTKYTKEDVDKYMNRCISPHCDGICKRFQKESCVIAWCPVCGRFYQMPFSGPLDYNPFVPEWTKKKEAND